MHIKILKTTVGTNEHLPPLTIFAIGGCMTTGFPIKAECGFANVAASSYLTDRSIKLQLTSLHGFTCIRAKKWVLKLLLTERVDYTIIQFGSTDASIPLKEKLPFVRQASPSSKSTDISEPEFSDPPHPPLAIASTGLKAYLQWWAEGFLRWCLRAKPRVETASYATIMADLAAELTAKTTPIILSPFVMGDPISQSSARRHTTALARTLADLPEVIFVNAFDALSRHPRHHVLLPDGMHLNARGHDIVSREIAKAISTHSSRLSHI